MNKYFYPIFKLPTFYERDYVKEELPLWVKWWLLGKAGRKLSEILTGSEFTLLHTLNRKFKILQIKGNTEQEQLSGKNLLDGANPTGANFATATMIGNIIKVSSTATNTTPIVMYEINNVQQGDTYRINAIIKNSNGQIVLQTKQNDSWTTYTILSYNNGTSISGYSYVIGTNVEAIRYLLYADKSTPTGASKSNYENVIVTKNNSDMTYEPYCRTEYLAPTQTFHNQ